MEGFTVRRQPAVLVAPSGSTPRELKRLSDIDDQDVLRFHIGNLLFYRYDVVTGSRDPAPVFRHAIARALVDYYPLAGRLRELDARKLAVDCTGEGVLFVEADADVRMADLGDPLWPPFPWEEELLFDVPGSSALLGTPLMLFQVTRLACGGFVLGVRMQHAMADGQGLVQFLGAVAELARGAPAPTVRPVWERELLMARDPPRPAFTYRMYEEMLKAKGDAWTFDCTDMAHRCFFFGAREVAAVRSHLAPGLRERASRFDVLAGCLWRCRTVALAPDDGEQMRVAYTVSARGRNSKGGAAIPSGYYGNAVACQVAVAAGELRAKPLSYAVELVRQARAEVNLEFMQSLADLMVQRERPNLTVVNAFFMSDVSKAGFSDIDFGWSKPAFAGQSCMLASFLTSSKDAKGDDGTLVPMFLPRPAMDKFVQEIGKLLRPADSLTSAL